jgi:hypothetical protein
MVKALNMIQSVVALVVVSAFMISAESPVSPVNVSTSAVTDSGVSFSQAAKTESAKPSLSKTREIKDPAKTNWSKIKDMFM